jgi:hypothetical protein
MTTIKEILDIQNKWAQEVIAIGKDKTDQKKCRTKAKKFLEQLYAFDLGTVLFKPTRVNLKQFRVSKDAALSYFVAGDKNFAEDQGFALQPWTQIRFENIGYILEEHRALAMGNCYFKDSSGKEIKVEYTLGYIKDKEKKLRIDLHHSSIPFDL